MLTGEVHGGSRVSFLYMTQKKFKEIEKYEKKGQRNLSVVSFCTFDIIKRSETKFSIASTNRTRNWLFHKNFSEWHKWSVQKKIGKNIIQLENPDIELCYCVDVFKSIWITTNCIVLIYNCATIWVFSVCK